MKRRSLFKSDLKKKYQLKRAGINILRKMAKGPVDLSRPRIAAPSAAAARRLEQAKPLQVCSAKKGTS